MKSLKKFLVPIKRKIDIMRTRIDFFRFEEHRILLPAGGYVATIDSLETYWNFPYSYPETIHEEITQSRLVRGDALICLVMDGTIVCHGWLYGGDRFYLFEIDKTLCLENNTFLYDFVTPRNFRNRGYYKALLSNIPSFFSRKNFLIGAVHTNAPSIRGILGAGYTPCNDIKFCS